jgi:C1A family cysteine protease
MTDQITHSYKLCYKFQPVDSRDYKYVAPVPPPVSAGKGQAPVKANPSIFSLRSKMAPILDQGSLGSCVSNAYALTISTMTLSKNIVNISRLMNYATTRVMTGDSILNDDGLYVRDAAKCISKYGACQETVWPYTINKFAELPPLNAFQSSKLFNKFT